MIKNNKAYNNINATLAIAKASFRSIIRSPSAVVFSLAFPLIFIVVFANIGNGGVNIDVGVAKGSDTINPVYKALKGVKVVKLITSQSAGEMKKNLSKGSIDAIIDFKNNGNWSVFPPLSALPAKPAYTI
jgi:ABC-2 type transport system permease protein